MNDDLAEAVRDAEKAAGGTGPGRIIDMLTSRIGPGATTAAVFGEPVVRAGVTVIPVAKVRWGFGGGGGAGTQPGGTAAGEGGGGAGGVTASPIGFIEVRDNMAVFHRIPPPPVAIILAASLVVLVSLRGIRRILRG